MSEERFKKIRTLGLMNFQGFKVLACAVFVLGNAVESFKNGSHFMKS
jgi:hypothetical protein